MQQQYPPPGMPPFGAAAPLPPRLQPAPPGTMPHIKVINLPVSDLTLRTTLQDRFAAYRPIKTYRDANNWYLVFIDIQSRDLAVQEQSKPQTVDGGEVKAEDGVDAAETPVIAPPQTLELEAVFKPMPVLVQDSEFITEYTGDELQARVRILHI
jgi:hypothetical protein